MEHGIIVNSDGFKETLKSFNKDAQKVVEKFNNIDNAMKDFDGESNLWKGKTCNKVIEKYQLYHGGFKDITETLKKYSVYLGHVIENYENENNSIDTSVDNNDGLMI